MQLEELRDDHEGAFLAMLADFEKGGHTLIVRKNAWSPGEFRKFVKDCERERMDWRPKAGKVSLTHYVLREPNGDISAYARLRFPLNEITEKDGGNLQVDVPPAYRRQGNGSFALSLLLFQAVRAGLSRALCTCLADDQAARRVIEKNRGKFLDTVSSPTRAAEIARYWITFR